jgi:hypothetical protein
MGDVLHQRLQEIIGDRSSPSTVRKDLSAFFKRRLAYLNIKKNKMISRWVFHSRMVNLILTIIFVFSPFLISKRMEYFWKRALENFSKKLT